MTKIEAFGEASTETPPTRCEEFVRGTKSRSVDVSGIDHSPDEGAQNRPNESPVPDPVTVTSMARVASYRLAFCYAGIMKRVVMRAELPPEDFDVSMSAARGDNSLASS